MWPEGGRAGPRPRDGAVSQERELKLGEFTGVPGGSSSLQACSPSPSRDELSKRAAS